MITDEKILLQKYRYSEFDRHFLEPSAAEGVAIVTGLVDWPRKPKRKDDGLRDTEALASSDVVMWELPSDQQLAT
jgi:hypothetical protein